MGLAPGWDSITGANWWSNLFFWGSIIALIGLGICEIVSHRYGERKDELVAAQERTTNDRHEEEMARLHVQLENAKKETALADARLLAEQRLTASERTRLARLERAVLPRSIPADLYARLLSAIRGLGPVNIAFVKKAEPRAFAFELMRLFSDAQIMGRLIELPADTDVPGDLIYAPNKVGERLGQILWSTTNLSQTRIGGRSTGTNKLSVPDLSGIPGDETCIVIGTNDAAMQPPDGQPGEAIDEHGRPVPEPRQ